MTKLTLNDVFNEWLDGKGLISYLTENFNVAWKNSADGEILDLEYHGNRSGTKIVSPLLLKMVDENGISDENAIKLCSLIFTKYSLNWQKLWETMSFEYDPISNYNMTEVETGTKNRTENGSDERTTENTRNDSMNIDGNNIGQIYGFNSSDPVNSEKNTTGSESTNDSSGTTNDSGSFTNSGNETENRRLTRSGNIGVTTSQQMIESERKLWDWKFFEKVFEDIDSIVVLQVFGKDHGGMDDFIIKTNYVLKPATETTLGGIKVGNNLSIESDGTLNAEEQSDPYILPIASQTTLGGIKVGENLEITEDGVLNAIGGKAVVVEIKSEQVTNRNINLTGNISIFQEVTQ